MSLRDVRVWGGLRGKCHTACQRSHSSQTAIDFCGNAYKLLLCRSCITPSHILMWTIRIIHYMVLVHKQKARKRSGRPITSQLSIPACRLVMCARRRGNVVLPQHNAVDEVASRHLQADHIVSKIRCFVINHELSLFGQLSHTRQRLKASTCDMKFGSLPCLPAVPSLHLHQY